jgi:cell division protein FtsQ
MDEEGGGQVNRLMKILLIVPVLYLFLMPVYMASSSNSKPCTRIMISIKDSADYHFITERQLLNLVYGNDRKILGQPVKSIPLSEIEDKINDLRELKVAETYMSVDGTLHVYADQRNPIMRVIPDQGGDYFIDKDGIVFSRRNLYTPRLHIIEGNVNISQAMLEGISILDTIIKRSILKDVYNFVNYINGDSFWSAQIDQIYVTGQDEIDLMPRVGNHVVHLGTFENYEGKLRNLEAFYEKVLPVVGWNKYSVISLQFEDQIVCKKRK